MSTQWPTPPEISDSLQTEEMISGFVAVCVSQSGNLRVAMPAVSGRMPAIGICPDNWNSGDNAVYKQFGSVQANSGLTNFGQVGLTVWIGRSGQLSQWNTSWMSGGYQSGDIRQRAGIALNSGGLRIHLELSPAFSGVAVPGAIAIGLSGAALSGFAGLPI
jgi:hypothetical protein